MTPEVGVLSLTSGHRLLLGLGVAVGIGLAAALTMAIGSIVPLGLAALGVTIAAYAPVVGWRAAYAVCLLGALVLEVCLQWLTPHVGWSLWTDDLVVWSLIGLAHTAVVAARPPVIGRRDVATAGMIALPALLVLGYFWLAWHRPGAPWVAWGMQNDAGTNAFLTRLLVSDGGLLTDQGNPAPLATALNGAWSAGGVEGFRVSGIVRHVILSSEQLSIALWLLVGITLSILALGRRPDHPVRRTLVALIAGFLPWTWFMSGWAMNLGFLNVAPAVLVLVLAWLCWLEQDRYPIAALTGQILATWAAALAWGPVAVLPAFLILGTVWTQRSALRRRGPALLLPAGTFVCAALYAWLVTLDQATAPGNVNALAFDGAHPNLDETWTRRMVIILAVATLVLYRWTPRLVRRGFWFALPGGLIGAAYLLNARKDQAELWGYYPIKFSWIVMCACMAILFTVIQFGVGRISQRLWRGTGLLVAVAITYTGMYKLIPPAPWVPVSLSTVVAPVGWHDTVGLDAPVRKMFDIMRKHRQSVVVRLSPGGAAADNFMNFWLMQSAQTSISDPIHASSYTVDSTSAEWACAVNELWQGGTKIWTRDPKLKRELRKACNPAFPYTVKVLPPVRSK